MAMDNWRGLQGQWRKACYITTKQTPTGLDTLLGPRSPRTPTVAERSSSTAASLARKILQGECKIPGEKQKANAAVIPYLADAMARDIDESIRLPHRCAFEAAVKSISPRRKEDAKKLKMRQPLSFLHIAFDGCVLDTGEKFVNRPACGSAGDESSQPLDPEFSRLLFQLSGDSELASLRDHYRELEVRGSAFINGEGAVLPPRVRHDQVHPVVMRPGKEPLAGA